MAFERCNERSSPGTWKRGGRRVEGGGWKRSDVASVAAELGQVVLNSEDLFEDAMLEGWRRKINHTLAAAVYHTYHHDWASDRPSKSD